MPEIQDLLRPVKRPGLLVRAARHALTEYDRDRHLRRILRAEETPPPAAAASQLFEIEQTYEDRRRAADAGYSVQRHIEVLCALMAEARLLRAGQSRASPHSSSDQLAASAMPAFLRAV